MVSTPASPSAIGRWPGCQRRLAALCRRAERKAVRDLADTGKLRQHVADLLGYFALAQT
jgi:hypothetical protein